MGRCVMVAALLGVVLAAPAQGQANGPLNQLEQRIREHREMLEKMQKEMDDMKSSMAEGSAARKVEAEKQKTKLTLEFSNGFKMYYKDPKTGNKRFAMQIGGRLQIDGKVRLTHNDRKLGSSTLNTFRERRIYLGAKGTVYTYWHWVLNLELEGGTVVSNTTNYIANTYFKKMSFRIGQMATPYGLEPSISNKYVRLIERSMAANFISPFYNLGFMTYGVLADKKVAYYVMVSNGNETSRQDNDDFKHIWARLLFKPMKGIHTGVSASYGLVDKLSPGSEAGSGVSTAPGTRIINYADGVVIDGAVWRLGAEAGYMNGPFGVWGEWMYLEQDLATSTFLDELELVGRRTIKWQGGHVTLGYFLTGEEMTFGRPKVLKPCEPGQPDSGMGAIELIARYDTIFHNLGSDPGFFVEARDAYRADQVMAGANWYPNDMVKVALNWQYARWNRRDGELSPRNQHTLMMRVQLEF